MKKLLIMLLAPILLVGCDKGNDKDIDISSTTHYVNTSESVNIRTFNDFRLINSSLSKNKNGEYRLILDFRKIFS